MEDGKGMLDGRRKERGAALHIASHSHPPIAFASASLPLFAPFLHLSNFKATWRENMSVTGGIILGGQCFSLKHAQQIHAISHEASPEWQLISGACHPLHRLSPHPPPPLISALIWFDPLAFFSLCCSCYCQARWQSLRLKQLNCRLGGLTWEGWQLPA